MIDNLLRTTGLAILTLLIAACGGGSGPSPGPGTPSPTNVAPVANAGAGQNVVTGSLVTLNGSGSTDANGDALTYSWAFTSLPTGSTATLGASTSSTPTFVPDLSGLYVVQLSVSDGSLTSSSVTVAVNATTTNTAPAANAGLPQNVLTGSLVTLDGSLSTDANGDALTYSWSITSKPTGSLATLVGGNSARPTFTADTDGTYSVALVVGDGQLSSTPATVTIAAATANVAPVANAGANQNVLTGSTVTLSGAGSTDANGDALTYLWTISSKPSGSTVGGQATTQTATFTPDVDGTYVISLVVNDGALSSLPVFASVVATSANAAPVAFAGANQSVFTNGTVTLNGSGSSDANGDTLSFSWSLISQPAGSGVVPLSSPLNVVTTFVPPIAGTYVFALVVNDGQASSLPHTVVVTATDAAPPTVVSLFLFGGPSTTTYLGCLNCNSFSAESVCNGFGTYGSEFSSSSIWNAFGTYGSQFSSYSPWNQFSSQGPAIYGGDGLFYGYFTTNRFRANRTLLAGPVNVLDFFISSSNLSATRTFACGP